MSDKRCDRTSCPLLGRDGLCMVPEKFCYVHRADEICHLRDENKRLNKELEVLDECLRFALINLTSLGASQTTIDKLKSVLRLDALDKAFAPIELRSKT
jgi:hypothetical protein